MSAPTTPTIDREHEDEQVHGEARGNGHQHDANGQDPHEPDVNFQAPPTSFVWVTILGAIVVGIMAALFFLGWLPKHREELKLEQEAEQRRNALPRVDVEYPLPGKSHFELFLPGTVDALQETAIYARTNGYLKKWYHDIGDRVSGGELLAEIDAPDVDEQVKQASATLERDQANLARSQSNVELARSTLERYQQIIATGGVTIQQIDERKTALSTAEAAYNSDISQVDADKADLARLTDIQSFQKIYAPFNGTITARNDDIGALITAGGSSGGQPIFNIAETDKVRVFVNVPQSYVTAVRPGDKATLSLREYPGQTFSGYVARTTGALDLASRTLQTEVDVPNANYALLRGMYADVHIEVTQPRPPLIVPTGALMFNKDGTRLALVRLGQTPTTKPAAADDPEPADGVVHYQNVTVGRDFGSTMEITVGLHASDLVITNPGENLMEGLGVKLITQPGEPPTIKPEEEVIPPPATTLPLQGTPRVQSGQ